MADISDFKFWEGKERGGTENKRKGKGRRGEEMRREDM